MRESDLLARYGGEEFLFCLVGMDEPDSRRLLQRPDTCLYRAKHLGRNRMVSAQAAHSGT